jgi:C4-dicarboxylate-specific signal transduction histidine kinase
MKAIAGAGSRKDIASPLLPGAAGSDGKQPLPRRQLQICRGMRYRIFGSFRSRIIFLNADKGLMDADVFPDLFPMEFLFPAGMAGFFILLHSALLHHYQRITRRWRQAQDALQAAERQLAEQLNQLAHLGRVTQLGEMSASLAHELRQPLAAILSSAQAAQHFLGRSRPSRPKVAEMLADISLAGRQADGVIQRLHAMSRREPVAHRAVNLNDLVAETLRLLKGELALRGVTPCLELHPSLPAVRGDPVQLQQVVVNFVLNACDAMKSVPPRERCLCVDTRFVAPARVSLVVADRGPGLSPAVAAKLFQPFQTSKPDGLGLGLAICRAIAATHLGQITGENHPGGRGAVFSLTLPSVEPVTTAEPVFHEIAHHHLCRG